MFNLLLPLHGCLHSCADAAAGEGPRHCGPLAHQARPHNLCQVCNQPPATCSLRFGSASADVPFLLNTTTSIPPAAKPKRSILFPPVLASLWLCSTVRDADRSAALRLLRTLLARVSRSKNTESRWVDVWMDLRTIQQHGLTQLPEEDVRIEFCRALLRCVAHLAPAVLNRDHVQCLSFASCCIETACGDSSASSLRPTAVPTLWLFGGHRAGFEEQ
jgi:hypothetical protein